MEKHAPSGKSPDWMRDSFCRRSLKRERGKISKLRGEISCSACRCSIKGLICGARELLLLHGITPINSLLQTITNYSAAGAAHPAAHANSQLLAAAKMHCRCVLYSGSIRESWHCMCKTCSQPNFALRLHTKRRISISTGANSARVCVWKDVLAALFLLTVMSTALISRDAFSTWCASLRAHTTQGF